MNDTAEMITDTESAANPLEDLQTIGKKVYQPENLQSGIEYVDTAVTTAKMANVEPVFNFDPDEGIDETQALAVVPLTERVPERGNVTKNILVAAIPTVEAILNDEAGKKWALKHLTDALIRQVVSAAKSKDGELQSLPVSIADFVTTSRSSGLAAFNAVASDFVTVLKKKGMKFLTKPLLRQILSSASFAASQFHNVTQEQWEFVIQKMIEHAAKDGIEAGLLDHWLKTRNEVEISTDEIDLSGLADLV